MSVSYQNYNLYTQPDGSIEGRTSTNDDEDRGYATSYAEWGERYRDLDEALKRTGGTHVGCGGTVVTVWLDGERVGRDGAPCKAIAVGEDW